MGRDARGTQHWTCKELTRSMLRFVAGDWLFADWLKSTLSRSNPIRARSQPVPFHPQNFGDQDQPIRVTSRLKEGKFENPCFLPSSFFSYCANFTTNDQHPDLQTRILLSIFSSLRVWAYKEEDSIRELGFENSDLLVKWQNRKSLLFE